MRHKNDPEFNAKLYGKQKFSFRKLTIGLCAVALGTTFYLSNGSLVHADEPAKNSEPASSEVVKTDSKDTTSGQTSEETASQGQDSTSANQNNEVTTPNDKKSQDTSTKDANDSDQSVTISSKDLGNSNVASSELNDNKVKKPVVLAKQVKTDSVTAKATDENGNETSTINSSSTTKLEAGQDNVNVHINFDNLGENDNKVDIKLSNVGSVDSNQPLVLNESNFADGSTITLDNWSLTNNGNGSITANWNSTTQSPASLDLTLTLQGNQNLITKDNENQYTDVPVEVSITKNSGDENYTAFRAQLTPYEDKVKSDEIVKGFPMGTTTVASEKSYGNISDADIAKNNASDDQTVAQWGAYFNYGKGGAANPDLNPLYDAIFHLTLNGDQTILPSSIKVYEVPDGMALDSNGDRIGINDTNPATGETYYHSIVTNANERSDFETYLKNQTKNNSIEVDQTINGQHVQFYVPKSDGTNDTSYSHHAYFIQFDSLLPKKQTVPSDKDTLTYSYTAVGTGTTVTQTVSWKGQVNGGGIGNDKTETQSATVNEKVIYYYENGPHATLGPKATNSENISNVPDSDQSIYDDNPKSATYTWTHNKNTGENTDYNSKTNDFGTIDFPTTLAKHDQNSYGSYTIDKNNIQVVKTGIDANSAVTGNKNGSLTFDPTKLANKDNVTVTIYVPYKLSENITVHYIDEDNNGGTEISDSNLHNNYDNYDPNSQADNSTQADINYLVSKGYILDTNATDGGNAHIAMTNYTPATENFKSDSLGNSYSSANLTFDNDEDPNNQVYYVYLYHNVTKGKETKTITENIKYVDENKIAKDLNVTKPTAKEIYDAAQGSNGSSYEISPKYKSQVDITLTRVRYYDAVTKKTTYSAWGIANKFDRVTNPNIDKYTIDPNKIYEEFNNNESSLAGYDKNNVHSVNGGLIKKQYNDNALTDLPKNSVLNIVVPYTENTHEETESKSITEDIKYVDEDAIAQDLNVTNPTIKQIYAAAIGKDGSKYELAPEYKSAIKIVFTRKVIVNDVTKEKTPVTAWSIANAFPAVAHPNVSGYTVDAKKIGEAFNGDNNNLATHNGQQIGKVDKNRIKYLYSNLDDIKDGAVLQVVVPYKKNPQPVNPTQPTNPTSPTAPTNNPSEPTSPTNPSTPTQPVPVHPEQPTNNPSQPTQIVPVHPENPNNSSQPTKIVPVHPENINVPTKQSKTNTSSHAHVEKLSNVQPKAEKTNAKTLPQTGEKQNQLGILGLGIAAIAALLGLAGDRKRKNS